MKACIYQKQDPVDIPQIETRILVDVLNLPWGVEVYDLLTRWNPLRQQHYLPKAFNARKILVMGMGPAGFTMAHYLLQEGFAVVGVDGLKLEPLPAEYLSSPIASYQAICESLDDRVMAGFGGVAEYGITVRWDKNFLKLIYINLMRRPYFQAFGSVRFGGTLTVEKAWELGFDHLTVAVGAGLPRELHIPHSLVKGMRQANDFLMTLQLSGAAKASSLANLQVQLPAVVVGGGLTGIDTATEVQAYYIAQVEKLLHRYEVLAEYLSEQILRQSFQPAELAILDEMVTHGKLIREERQQALQQRRAPNFIRLLREWGGVTVVYRRRLTDSPAYHRNHEEVNKALEEGIYYAEGLQPIAVKVDKQGWASGLVCQWCVLDDVGRWSMTHDTHELPARSIFVATGAKPNVAYEFEHEGTFLREGFQYRRFTLGEHELREITAINHVKSPDVGFFTSYATADKRVTFIGDTHSTFHGSVVKAIASAKRAYLQVSQATLATEQSQPSEDYDSFRARMHHLFQATVQSVIKHHDDLVEISVHAPLATQQFHPGQFYRLQNFARSASTTSGTSLQSEALALIGYKRLNSPKDTLSFAIKTSGVSAKIIASLKTGSALALMGPTGARSKIPVSTTVMIVGHELAIAHLLSVGPALRTQHNRVLFVGCGLDSATAFAAEDIAALADECYWLADDLSDADQLLQSPLLSSLSRVTIVGSTAHIRHWRQLYRDKLQPRVADDIRVFAAVHSPMQCMLKGVCAQCLQWQIDPETGHRKKAVYACSWQNQPLAKIDVDNLDERLSQNLMQERFANIWLEYLQSTGEFEC